MRSIRIQPGRARWLLLPMLAVVTLLGGCSAFGGTSTSAISPADATVTAIVTQSVNPNCANSLTPSLVLTATSTTTSNSVSFVLLGKTNVTFVGTCWLPNLTVTIGVLSHPATAAPNQGGIVTPLLINGAPITGQVQADGTFSIKALIPTEVSPYVWDNRLPFVAYIPGYVQFAATSVEVSFS